MTGRPLFPLFPLGAVLFPGVLLPLHVFEERYRAMVRDLLDAPDGERCFGVVAIREGREVGADGIRALHPVGCLARLRRVEPYADGRFDIVSTGDQRFRLIEVDDGLPYLRGAVELIDETPGDDPQALVPGVTLLYARYLDALGADPDLDVPADPEALSYLVAGTAVLETTEKQRLLEAPDVSTRLRMELRLLHRETTIFHLLPSLPGVELTRTPASPN